MLKHGYQFKAGEKYIRANVRVEYDCDAYTKNNPLVDGWSDYETRDFTLVAGCSVDEAFEVLRVVIASAMYVYDRDEDQVFSQKRVFNPKERDAERYAAYQAYQCLMQHLSREQKEIKRLGSSSTVLHLESPKMGLSFNWPSSWRRAKTSGVTVHYKAHITLTMVSPKIEKTPPPPQLLDPRIAAWGEEPVVYFGKEK